MTTARLIIGLVTAIVTSTLIHWLFIGRPATNAMRRMADRMDQVGMDLSRFAEAVALDLREHDVRISRLEASQGG